MSQVTIVAQSGGGGVGTVTSVSGGNNITITGTPTINPTVNVSGTTNHSLLLGNSTGSLTSLGVATNGQLAIGSTGANPVLATLQSAGSTITVTNTTGAINLEASAALTWSDVTGSTQTIVPNSGYVLTTSSLVTFTLPVTSAKYTIISIVDTTGFGWQINQNSGQYIIMGVQQSQVGTGGNIFSADVNANTAITLLCVVADTGWAVFGGPLGNIGMN